MKKRGISLIVLIVTIIVVIILAAVVILTLSKNNPIESAKEARFKEDVKTFQDELAMTVSKQYAIAGGNRDEKITTLDFEEIKGYIPSFSEKYRDKFGIQEDELKYNNVTNIEKTWCDSLYIKLIDIWVQNQDGIITKGNTKLNIGDYVNYETLLSTVTLTSNSQIIKDLKEYSGNTDNTQNTEFTITQERNLRWRVLDVKDGKLRLISAIPTNSMVKLEGYDGYNNGVFLMDEICQQLYSSSNSISQNLKIEDIQNQLTYEYTQSRDGVVKYGMTKEYNSTLNYPQIYPSEVGCKAISIEENIGKLSLSEQKNLIKGKNKAISKIIVTQTSWKKTMQSSDFVNALYYDIFVNNGQNYNAYYLSSRALWTTTNGAVFCISCVKDGMIDRKGLKDDWSNYGGTFSFRPVTTLASNVNIKKDETHDGSTAEKSCIIQ